MNARLMNYAMPLLLVAIFYFMLIRPQKKRENQLKEMRLGLKTGDHITTIGGVHGRITKVTENTVTIVTSEAKTKLVFEKWAVGKVVMPEDAKDRENEAEKTVAVDLGKSEDLESTPEVSEDKTQSESTEEK